MDSSTWLVINDSTYEIRVASSGSVDKVKVVLSLDGRREWSLDQPSWRPLSFGFEAELAYLWSARSVIVFPFMEHESLSVVEVDEDLIRVFRRGGHWLIICETSVRLLDGNAELSRVELADVVARASWDRGDLVIFDAAEQVIRITVGDDLVSRSSEGRRD